MPHIPPLYDKKLTCTICNHDFSSKKLRTRSIRVEKIENDLYTTYKDPDNNPLLYEVFVCDTCGYAFTEQFKEKMTEEVKQKFKHNISTYWKEQSFSEERTHEEAVTTYKLALLSAKETEQAPIIIAGICLRLSWLNRYLENEEEEQKYIKSALKYYETSYIQGDFKDTSMTELQLLFLLGELSRKLGLKEQAVKHFSTIAQHPDRHYEPSLVEKARDQWYLMREKE